MRNRAGVDVAATVSATCPAQLGGSFTPPFRKHSGLSLPREQTNDDGTEELARAILEPTFRSRF